MKKLAFLKLCLSTAFVVYLVVAIDFFPLEMHFNLLEWDGTRPVRFVIVFIVVLFFCRWAEFEKFFTKKQKGKNILKNGGGYMQSVLLVD